MFHRGVIFVIRLLSLSFVIADTSLYIPGYGEEPVSVTVVGVGSDGRTTWRIEPQKPTGTVSPGSYSLTATMVQGPSDAVVVASFPGQLDYSLSCAIKSSMANCVGEIVANANGMTLTTSLQEPVKPYLVQGGGSGSWSPPAPTPPPNGSGSNSSSEGVNGSPASTSTVMQRVGLLVGSVVVGAAAFFLV